MSRAATDRIERLALGAALFALAGGIVLAFFARSAIGPAYRLAAFAWLQPAVGSLIFALIHRITGGQWGESLGVYLQAGVRLLPWIWLLVLPLVYFHHPMPPPLGGKIAPHPLYLNRGFTLARALLYGGGFVALGRATARSSRAALAAEAQGRPSWAPGALIALIILLHLLAADWFFPLEPGWFSTAFPIVWMAGAGIAGFSGAVGAALIAGARPGARGSAGRPVGIDWGNLLLTTVLFWTYLAFMQFLIIWAENMPQELSWYLRRARGPWLVLIILLAILHFGLPFLFLLSRRLKTSAAALGGVAALLFAGQLALMAWMVLPAFPRPTPAALTLELALLVAGGGFFLNRYLSIARRIGREAA